MKIDKQALREAAEKYRTTYAAHLKNPRNYDALDAWDKATSEFMALVNNDELNIIASLIDEIDMETGYREGAFVACNRWHTKFRETEAKLEAAEQRNAELVHNHRVHAARLIDERGQLKQRIAELEARTVKLPYLPADCDRTEAHFKYQEAIRAAGIQVIEGEQKNG
ncbi:TPA: ead/Ea22-like family protein [Citrobacter koseri]